MRRLAITMALLMIVAVGNAQVPAGFHWLNFKTDTADLARITDSLKTEKYTAIREVGIAGDFAVVFIVERDKDTSIPDEDGWTVYSVSMKSGKATKLLSGMHLEMREWVHLQPAGMEDLIIVYHDCWECESAAFLTALHLDPNIGWRARWIDNQDRDHPGILIRDGVVEEFGDDAEDRVWAVVYEPEGNVVPIKIGTWVHTRSHETGNVTDTVMRYSADPATGKDLAERLTLVGPATEWKRTLCLSQSAPLAEGQATGSCKRLLKVPPKAVTPLNKPK